jgi:hypothetical protein
MTTAQGMTTIFSNQKLTTKMKRSIIHPSLIQKDPHLTFFDNRLKNSENSLSTADKSMTSETTLTANPLTQSYTRLQEISENQHNISEKYLRILYWRELYP